MESQGFQSQESESLIQVFLQVILSEGPVSHCLPWDANGLTYAANKCWALGSIA